MNFNRNLLDDLNILFNTQNNFEDNIRNKFNPASVDFYSQKLERTWILYQLRKGT